MARRERSSRGLWVLLLSVALHGAVLFLIPGDVERPVVAVHRPIEIEIFEVEPPAPQASPPSEKQAEPSKPVAKRAPLPPQRKPEETLREKDGPGPTGGSSEIAAAPPTVASPPPSESPEANPTEAPLESAPPEAPAQVGELLVPLESADAGEALLSETFAGRAAERRAKALGLTPSLDPTAPLPPVPIADAAPGRTSRPSDEPSAEELRAEAGKRVKSRVDGWISDDLAELRVENGLVDGYFGDLRRRLRETTEGPPAFNTNLAKTIIGSYLDSAGNYGGSGSPYTVPQHENAPPASDLTDPLAQAAERSKDAKELLRKLNQGKTLRQYAAGDMSKGLLVLVELRQAGDGQLDGAYLIESSGNAVFDAHVMKTAPEAVTTLGLPVPDAGSGIHADGLRSLWAFIGKVDYRKKLKDVKTKDTAALAAMVASGLLTGGFDEVTGDVYVVDLADPSFRVQVKLLRVY